MRKYPKLSIIYIFAANIFSWIFFCGNFTEILHPFPLLKHQILESLIFLDWLYNPLLYNTTIKRIFLIFLQSLQHRLKRLPSPIFHKRIINFRKLIQKHKKLPISLRLKIFQPHKSQIHDIISKLLIILSQVH